MNHPRFGSITDKNTSVYHDLRVVIAPILISLRGVPRSQGNALKCPERSLDAKDFSRVFPLMCHVSTKE